MQLIARFAKDESAATAIEYGLIAAGIAVVIIAAVIYVVSPLDAIPDSIPGIGFLDDATVLSLALKRTRNDLDDFMAWELTTS